MCAELLTMTTSTLLAVRLFSVYNYLKYVPDLQQIKTFRAQLARPVPYQVVTKEKIQQSAKELLKAGVLQLKHRFLYNMSENIYNPGNQSFRWTRGVSG